MSISVLNERIRCSNMVLASPIVRRGPLSTPRRVATRSSSSATAAEIQVGTLKQAVRQPGSVPPSEVLKALVDIEKAKIKLPDDWLSLISAPNKRWRLIYTADQKGVQATLKGKPAKGVYFPLTACQKFDVDNTFENGVFLGPVGHLTFKGPCISKGKQLSFDVHTMFLGIGPWRIGLPIKKEGKPLSQVEPREVAKLPFFLYAYIDEEIIVARGRSGGLALWVAADSKWQASAGVLQSYGEAKKSL